MMLAPSLGQAETFEYFEDNGIVHKDIVIINGETFILSTEQEIKKAVKNSTELASSKAQVALLLGKISLMEDKLEYGEDIQEMYRVELEYNAELLAKQKELYDLPFYEQFEFGLFAGALTMTLTFFLWEYGRSQ